MNVGPVRGLLFAGRLSDDPASRAGVHPRQLAHVVLLFSVVVLTLSRSMFIIVALVAVLQPALSKAVASGRAAARGLLCLGLSILNTARWRIQKALRHATEIQKTTAVSGLPRNLHQRHPVGAASIRSALARQSGFGAGRIGGGTKEGWCDSGWTSRSSASSVGSAACASSPRWRRSGRVTRRIRLGTWDPFLHRPRRAARLPLSSWMWATYLQRLLPFGLSRHLAELSHAPGLCRKARHEFTAPDALTPVLHIHTRTPLTHENNRLRHDQL